MRNPLLFICVFFKPASFLFPCIFTLIPFHIFHIVLYQNCIGHFNGVVHVILPFCLKTPHRATSVKVLCVLLLSLVSPGWFAIDSCFPPVSFKQRSLLGGTLCFFFFSQWYCYSEWDSTFTNSFLEIIYFILYDIFFQLWSTSFYVVLLLAQLLSLYFRLCLEEPFQQFS